MEVGLPALQSARCHGAPVLEAQPTLLVSTSRPRHLHASVHQQEPCPQRGHGMLCPSYGVPRRGRAKGSTQSPSENCRDPEPRMPSQGIPSAHASHRPKVT